MAATGVRNGVVTVQSKHTTTAVCVNENETRLFADVQARVAALPHAALRCAHRARIAQAFLLQLAPPLPKARYRHNDIELRCVALPLSRTGCIQPCAHADISLLRSDPPPGWTGGVEAWRDQEPINAHAHLASMLLGSSESIPLADGALQIGTWQSLLLIELDGPRKRKVGVHVMGE